MRDPSSPLMGEVGLPLLSFSVLADLAALDGLQNLKGAKHMKNHDKQYYIYLRSTRERIPCSKEEFDAYYHDIDLFRQKQEYHKRCVCPRRKWLECDMDCQNCPFYRSGTLSLDETKWNSDGEETAWIDTIYDESPHFEEILASKEQLCELLQRLNEIMPDALLVGQLRLKGLTDTEISSVLNIKQNTLFYRLRKAKEIMEREFPEYF